ncbi:DUF2784 domain-containing protein [Pseudomonas schmalbachii]|uniref:DUF2784 domain-containing protein n=1 Tax=Pseudomonas schmalbachii TaxID=2816993 RepID=A0ABS3TLF1_9PSED|nr:DUF2784 domain-containing protein [Pseudomonas schmalbachii]MBO3274486.1 DUF2784 domain-containing protein [Pseudomonas schmalbachii]
MIFRLAADAVLLLHLGFILFVVLGALLLLRWPRLAWLHLPAVAWGAYIEFSHGICPLTPLENRLRRLAGDEGYAGGFIEHYLVPLIYPGNLTDGMQLLFGLIVVLLNGALYGWLLLRGRRPAR